MCLYKDLYSGTSLVVQWLRLHTSNAGGMGLIPGGGTKIPHVAQSSHPPPTKKKNQTYIQMFSAALLNGKELETIQASISWWMDKQRVVPSNNGILSGNKKEQNTDTCYKMNAPQQYAN